MPVQNSHHFFLLWRERARGANAAALEVTHTINISTLLWAISAGECAGESFLCKYFTNSAAERE